MGRLKRLDQGFTLLELVIAVVLSTVVLLSASNLLIHFGKFSANVVKNEASLMGSALGAFEELVGKITAANQVAGVPDAPATSSTITVTVDTETSAGPPPVFGSTDYTYWLDGVTGNLRRTGVTGDPVAGTIIASDIEALSFSRCPINLNRITVILDAHTHSGSTAVETNKTREHLETTAIMRSRSAN